MKKISILGSTGVIGGHTLEIVDQFPEKFDVLGLSAGDNTEKLIKQIKKYQPKVVSVRHSSQRQVVAEACPGVEVLSGEEGLTALATMAEIDFVVAGVVGFAGMRSTLPISCNIIKAASLAPPCAGPQSAAIPAEMQANGLAPVEPANRTVEVDAFCS